MPAERIAITIDGRQVNVVAGTSVAAAMLGAGVRCFRRSVRGHERAAMCGMGICFECRVTIDGELYQLSCQTLCRAGMEVHSDGQ